MEDVERQFANIVKAYEQPSRAQRLRAIELACDADKGLDALVHNFIAARFETVCIQSLDECQLAEVSELCKGMAREIRRAESAPKNVVNLTDFKRP
ncbi:MAG: hypothetical protein AAF441_20010 [Pseudomonadota bacterium]